MPVVGAVMSAPTLPAAAEAGACRLMSSDLAMHTLSRPWSSHALPCAACAPAASRAHEPCKGSVAQLLGLGFRVQGSGFRVQGLGFRVQCLGLI